MQFQALLHECGPWLERLSRKYSLPRAVLVKMLRGRGALEYEIGVWIAEHAKQRAADLFASEEGAPKGTDLWDRAVRGVYTQLADARDRQEAEERRKRYEETDRELKRMRDEQIQEGRL